MSYSQAVRQLERFVKLEGVKPGLERITKLLSLLGNPHQGLPVIHVAGTNGKGSVTMMCTNALLECNYRIGSYLSPHLIKYNERFLFQGKEISDKEFSTLFQKVVVKAKQVAGITEFEVLTAMAFVYFKQKKVDVAVMEVGLGGRYDATNVCRSILAIITPIDYDHQAVLGKTLTAIAREKAGIMKPGIPVVSAAQAPEALAVLLKTAEQMESDFSVVYHPIKFKLSLLGDYQRRNAALVMEALDKLKKYNIYIPRRLILNGISNTYLPGRVEQVSDKPITILDVAHNPQAVQNLVDVLKENYPYKKKIFIFGLLKRKDLKSILKVLKPVAEQMIAVNLNTEEAYTAQEIASKALAEGLKIKTAHSVGEAYKTARKNSDSHTIIAVVGSFYLIGEFYKKFKRKGSK